MRVDILQLRLFLEVISAGSLTAAARRANIVQSALSRRIQMLEISVGSSLFVRQSDGMILTDAGRRLQAHAETILADYAALERDFGLGGSGASAEIKLGVTKSLAMFFQTVVAAGVLQGLPDVQVRLVEATSKTLHDWLLSREIDGAIATSWRANSSLEYYPLWQERLFIAMPPSTKGDLSDALTSAKSLPFIATYANEDLLKVAKPLLAAHGHDISRRVEMDSLPSLCRTVENGIGFTLLPYFAVNELMDSDRVRLFPLPQSISRYLVRRVSSPLTGTVSRFFTLLPRMLLQQVADCDFIEPLCAERPRTWSREALTV